MPAVKSDGYVWSRAIGDLEDYSLLSADKLADALADLLDRDGDNDDAIKNLVWLIHNNAKLMHILTLLLRKEWVAAEQEAMELVSSNGQDGVKKL